MQKSALENQQHFLHQELLVEAFYLYSFVPNAFAHTEIIYTCSMLKQSVKISSA
jgi:hypothetical protein